MDTDEHRYFLPGFTSSRFYFHGRGNNFSLSSEEWCQAEVRPGVRRSFHHLSFGFRFMEKLTLQKSRLNKWTL